MEALYLDKTHIKNRFTKAALSYQREALVQARVAAELCGLIQRFVGGGQDTMLEIGCGTGILSRQLLQHMHFEKYLLNDMSPAMLAHCSRLSYHPKQHLELLLGDAERVSFPKGLNLIASSATFQWLSDLDGFFAKCHEALGKEGVLAFSSFGEQNLQELTNLSGIGLVYYSVALIKAKLEAAGFELLYSRDYKDVLYFDRPLKVLQHLKHTGVTGVQKETWTKGRLAEFLKDYDRLYRTSKGVPLSYHPILMVARKIK